MRQERKAAFRLALAAPPRCSTRRSGRPEGQRNGLHWGFWMRLGAWCPRQRLSSSGLRTAAVEGHFPEFCEERGPVATLGLPSSQCDTGRYCAPCAHEAAEARMGRL